LVAQHQFEQAAVSLLQLLAPVLALPFRAAEAFHLLQKPAIELVGTLLDLLDEEALEQAEEIAGIAVRVLDALASAYRPE
jgi:hypothetical protein